MSRFLWLRRFIRRNTQPIELTRAELWKKRLSIMYIVLSFNAFGLVVIACLQGKSDWAKYYGLKTEEEMAIPPARQWATTLGIKNATVYKFKGLSKVGEYEIKEKAETEEHQNHLNKELILDSDTKMM